jgi:hypothetical protein
VAPRTYTSAWLRIARSRRGEAEVSLAKNMDHLYFGRLLAGL